MLLSIVVVACGGGGESSGGNTGGSNTSGTAAQYLTKNAVGNMWTHLETGVLAITGQPTSTSRGTQVDTITANAGGVVTFTHTYTPAGGTASPSSTYTEKIDATGALVSSDGIHPPVVVLPATFSIGTAWTAVPADSATGTSAHTATITAFNVTRIVPAGIFTDCLQINATWTETTAGVTRTANYVGYFSPSAGTPVEYIYDFSSTSGGIITNDTVTNKLQAGYISNP